MSLKIRLRALGRNIIVKLLFLYLMVFIVSSTCNPYHLSPAWVGEQVRKSTVKKPLPILTVNLGKTLYIGVLKKCDTR